MKIVFHLLLAALITAERASALSKYKTAPDSPNSGGHLEFLALGRPAMIRIKGEAPAPQGELTINEGLVQGQFRLALASLNTGIEMRDKHMKEKYLEVDKSPEAILIIESLSLKNLEMGDDLPFEGQLTLHGQKQKVSGKLSYKTPGPTQKTAHAEFKFKLSEFGIQIPSYAGITVADEVQLKIDLNLVTD